MGLLLLISFFLVSILSLHDTKAIMPTLYTDKSFMAIPTRIMLGMALLVCSMNVLIRFMPGESSLWVTIFLLLTVSLLLSKNNRLISLSQNKYEISYSDF